MWPEGDYGEGNGEQGDNGRKKGKYIFSLM